jgi:type I restriction enzyme S subunit
MAGEWSEVPLGDLCEVITKGTTPTSLGYRFTDTGINFIKSESVTFDGWIDDSKFARIDAKTHAALRRSQLKEGDVLFSMAGVYIGKTAVVRKDILPANTNQAVGIIRLNQTRAHPRFIDYFLRNPTYNLFLNNLVSQSAQPNLNLTEIRNLPIELPPLPEQKAIASVLGALDDKIELNRRMNATLEAMARALFQSWFVDFDPVRAKLDGRQPTGMDEATAALFPATFQNSESGFIPSGWQIKEVSEFIRRLSVGQKYEKKTVLPVGKIPVLDQGKSGVIGYHNNEPGISASLNEPVAVFANHTCYMRLVSYPFSAIQNVLPFVGSGVDTFWAYYATEGKLSFSEYKGHWPDFAIQKTVVPRRELTDRFGCFAKPLIARIQKNKEESFTLATLRDALLPKLLSGELRVLTAESQSMAAA